MSDSRNSAATVHALQHSQKYCRSGHVSVHACSRYNMPADNHCHGRGATHTHAPPDPRLSPPLSQHHSPLEPQTIMQDDQPIAHHHVDIKHALELIKIPPSMGMPAHVLGSTPLSAPGCKCCHWQKQTRHMCQAPTMYHARKGRSRAAYGTACLAL
jgi:hypothetical protein